MSAPKDRILAAASEIFARSSVYSVTLDEIVAAAETTKMALYRHYEGRDGLVVNWLSSVAEKSEERWDWLAGQYASDPVAQIMGWTRFMATRLPSPTSRGCPFVNTASELPSQDHPAWPVIRKHRQAVQQHIERLCRQAGFADAERLARGILYVVDGAQSNASGLSAEVVAADMVHMVKLLVGETASAT
jgi:AcrR family transcriptional regulator